MVSVDRYPASRTADGSQSVSKLCTQPNGLGYNLTFAAQPEQSRQEEVSAHFCGSYKFAHPCVINYKWDFAWTEKRAFWICVGLDVFALAQRGWGAILDVNLELRHWGAERVLKGNLANGASLVLNFRIRSGDYGCAAKRIRFAAEEFAQQGF